MNWLLKMLGYRDRDYHGDQFSVRIDPQIREGVSVIYTRSGISLTLSGERIGRKWEGIEVHVPGDLDSEQAVQVARDLEAAFMGLGYDYVIARKTGIETVPEPERRAALAELNERGYEIEILSDGTIRQTRRPGVRPPDANEARRQALRMASLIPAIHGTRQRLEIVAKSKEF
jgi:hypothetical protein